MTIVLLGHMGRDEAMADRLAGHTLYVLGEWANPGLVEKAEASGGSFTVIDSVTDVDAIADFVLSLQPDMFLTNFDDSLAAGVVDVVQSRTKAAGTKELLTPCPDRAAARVEWDKFYLRELVAEIDDSYNPINFMVEDSKAACAAIAHFEKLGTEIVIKPRNLTGGKGVKVQGKHFDSHRQGRAYAEEVLSAINQEGLEVQEKLEGPEFTLQIFTDGKTLIQPPATYDYPYRQDGDTGPGTGGMGAFSMMPGTLLPFLTQAEYDKVMLLMKKLLIAIRKRGDNYKGVLYPTFFKTAQGLRIVEVNARGGDPELINILDLIEDDIDFGEVLKSIALGELTTDSVRYKRMATALVYLVSPDYGYKNGPSHTFTVNTAIADRFGCRVRFAAAEKVIKHRYRTVGTSRVVGISSQADTPWAARQNILAYIKKGFGTSLPLEYRKQIADKAYIEGLSID